MTDGGQSQQVIALVHPGPLSSVISVALVIIHSVNIICTTVSLYYLMLHYFFRLERNFAHDETETRCICLHLPQVRNLLLSGCRHSC